MTERNWAGNVEFEAAVVHRPRSIDELRALMVASPKIHVVGTRHSFNDIADAAVLVSLDGLPEELVVDRVNSTITVSSAITYGRVAELLEPLGLALHNLASLPHISVGGAIATGTHGSGTTNGNLATAVSALEVVTSAGDLIRSDRRDPDFDGMVVSMGALGAVTAVTLDVEPAYEVEQRVYEGLNWDVLDDSFDAVFSAGYSVSAFTTFGDEIEQLWVKSRVDVDGREVGGDFHGAHAAIVDRHPISGHASDNCTTQRGVGGLWSDRLPHFKLGFTPSSGEEIQSEFFVALDDAAAAVSAVRSVRSELSDALVVSEIRTVAGDELWMSPHHQRTSAALHFTWKLDQAGAEDAAGIVGEVLAPFRARPHWGKLFSPEAANCAVYPRLADFAELADRMDSRHAFRNAWLERSVFGT